MYATNEVGRAGFDLEITLGNGDYKQAEKLRESLEGAAAVLDLVGWDREHDWEITLRTEDDQEHLARLVNRRREESVEIIEEADIAREQVIIDECDELLAMVGVG